VTRSFVFQAEFYTRGSFVSYWALLFSTKFATSGCASDLC